MSLIKKFSAKLKTNEKNDINLFSLFLDAEKSEASPFRMAVLSYQTLENQSENMDAHMQFMLEDIIFSSLYATFYEEVFQACHDNAEVAVSLINRFQEDQESRDQIIAVQTQNHLNYVLNGGTCSGCAECENHGDVRELIGYWENREFRFFAALYLGMTTIQYAMEYLLYDIIPLDSHYTTLTAREKILRLRQDIIQYVEDKINE